MCGVLFVSKSGGNVSRETFHDRTIQNDLINSTGYLLIIKSAMSILHLTIVSRETI